MTFASKLLNLIGFSEGLRVDLAMDLGTANTLIYVKGKGIIVNEPSVVAIDTRTNKPVAIGRTARQFLGRTPPHIRAERPLKDGVIADFDAAMTMVKGFLGKAFRPRFWLNPRIVIGVPSGITQVERRAVKDSAYQAGARHIFLVEEPMAAAMGAGLDVDMPVGNMVVDIGGGTTEVAIISLCATAYCESIRVAGDEMDEAILRYVQRNMHVEVTPELAEEIKIRIGCADRTGPEKKMPVTGKELGRGGPRTVEVTSNHVAEALEEPVDAILDTIRRALETAPPALLADVKERGLILSGGGALLSGLDQLIYRMTGIRAYMADDPLAAVVRGCGIALEDLPRWERIFVK
ncbi:MAG: rod shape-determining protein [Desulfomonile tiedjei]|uniref:Cell shape-determining protein MreB n=1 Tax=Desulfomonile tiedjei TaxID=2358 RepID=A0A9D6V6F6_9BACT|nr:rod shape-determining protein [Desulfomonile tiedjei]